MKKPATPEYVIFGLRFNTENKHHRRQLERLRKATRRIEEKIEDNASFRTVINHLVDHYLATTKKRK